MINEEQDLYRIGSVAALTGIAVERLRAWERRYGFAPAQRDGKVRFYSNGQLEKLKKMKRLLDHGATISDLIDLSDDQLTKRLTETPRQLPQRIQGRPQVDLIGANLLQLEQRQEGHERLDITARWANPQSFLEESASSSAETLVLQLPVLDNATIQQVSARAPNAALIIAYQFATADQVSQCDRLGLRTLRWPLSWEEIEFACLRSRRMAGPGGMNTQRQYSDEELIAMSVSDKHANQYTHQLVTKVQDLNALSGFLSMAAGEHEEQDSDLVASLDQAQEEIAFARSRVEAALESVHTAQLGDRASQSPSLPVAPSVRPPGTSTH